MSYENAPVPLSLFLEDGTILNSVKSEFMHKLEGILPATEGSLTCISNDGHATIQALNPPPLGQPTTFKDMAESFTRHITHHAESVCQTSSQIHVVFDEYRSDSIKAQTRAKRGAISRAHVHHVKTEMAIPRNWKAFLQQGENKSELARCYTDFMITNLADRLEPGQQIVTSGGFDQRTVQIATNDVKDVPDLSSNQEEADYRMVLHAIHAAKNGANCCAEH